MTGERNSLAVGVAWTAEKMAVAPTTGSDNELIAAGRGEQADAGGRTETDSGS